MSILHLLSQTPEQRFEAIIGLIGAVLVILIPLVTGVWKVASTITGQTDATNKLAEATLANTEAIKGLDERMERVEALTSAVRREASEAPHHIAEAIVEVNDRNRPPHTRTRASDT